MKLEQIEQLLGSIDSRYRAVIIAAKRAKQLQKGLRPIFEGRATKVTTMALSELHANKVSYSIEEIQAEPADAEETRTTDTSSSGPVSKESAE